MLGKLEDQYKLIASANKMMLITRPLSVCVYNTMITLSPVYFLDIESYLLPLFRFGHHKVQEEP